MDNKKIYEEMQIIGISRVWHKTENTTRCDEFKNGAIATDLIQARSLGLSDKNEGRFGDYCHLLLKQLCS